eukprot:7701276-Alexandrium_andersonii.AAC.1
MGSEANRGEFKTSRELSGPLRVLRMQRRPRPEAREPRPAVLSKPRAALAPSSQPSEPRSESFGTSESLHESRLSAHSCIRNFGASGAVAVSELFGTSG